MACSDPSLTDTSDEIREMFCEPCHRDNEYHTAEGFCVDCVEYLCSTCMKYHRRLKVDHTMQSSADMPKDFCFEKCEQHPAELIKFYCRKCQAAFCKVCKVQSHTVCRDINHIPEIVKSYDNGSEFKAVMDEIESLLNNKGDFENTAKVNLEQSRSLRSQVIEDIDRHRKKINVKLDKLQEEAIAKVESFYITDEEKLNKLPAEYQRLISNLTSMKTNLDILLQSGERSKLFLSSKKALKEIPTIRSSLKSLENQNKSLEYFFSPSRYILNDKNKNKTFGTVQVVAEPSPL